MELPKMKNLTEAGSTQTPAYTTLKALGYKVYREVNYEHQFETWFAEKNDIRFSASDVLSLLGLHSIWETRKERTNLHSDWYVKNEKTWEATDEERKEFSSKFPLVDYSEEFEGGRQFEEDDLPLEVLSECENISLRLVERGQCEARSKCKNPSSVNICMSGNDLSLCSEHLFTLRDLIDSFHEKKGKQP